MEKGRFIFEVGLNLGSNCVGQNFDETLDVAVELTSDETDTLRGWLGSHEHDYNMLEADLPGIYDVINARIGDALWWWMVEEGIANNGYEDRGEDLFEQEVRDGVYVLNGVDIDEVEDLIDLEDYDDLFVAWEKSKDKLDDEERKAYLETRYDFTATTDVSSLDYLVSFPEELI